MALYAIKIMEHYYHASCLVKNEVLFTTESFQYFSILISRAGKILPQYILCVRPNFACAKSINANELEERILLICIKFGT